jgi:hypothetical protein
MVMGNAQLMTDGNLNFVFIYCDTMGTIALILR